MKTSFAVKASLLATMIIGGAAFAQSLPDEINHPQYLKIYQSLEQVLVQKTAEFDKLSEQKVALERNIAQMEKDQVDLPSRNAELKKFIIQKKEEITQIVSQLEGLEQVLADIIEDLRKIDNMLAQLQRDLRDESVRGQQIQARRNQVAQEVAQIQIRLDKEVREENQSVQILNRASGELNATLDRKKDVERERSQLFRDVERFKGEIVQARNTVAQNGSAQGIKKPQLADAQAKLASARGELATAEATLAQIDVTLNPKKQQLSSLKAELARLSPDIARLQTENRTLEQKIAVSQGQINSSAVANNIAKRNALEADIASVKFTINSNNQRMAELQESIKPTMQKISELTVLLRQQSGSRNAPEVARLRAEIDALNASIAPQKQESLRLSKETERLAISIAPKQNEINTLNTAIANGEAQIATLKAEIEAARGKITQNEQKITELSQANTGLAQQIAALEVEVRALEAQREPTARAAASLRQVVSQNTAVTLSLTNEIQRLEAESQRLTAKITEMESVINTFPQESRRLDAHLRQLDEKISQSRNEIDREQRLLSRIRQDRMAVQAERDRSQAVLDQVNQELASSDRLISAIKTKYTEESGKREALTRYNQDSIRKLDALKVARTQAESDVAAAQEEIQVNEQDIATVSQELPKLRGQLAVLNPKVTASSAAKVAAQKNVTDANSQYQDRLALYQSYLSQAQALGAQRAAVGSVDGTKAGAIDAKAKAQKLASENALVEGKWEALRRGYIRGEVAGYSTGFDLGMSSASDATRGEAEGQVAGMKRAKDHANLVIKPERYLEELERRLKEDQVTSVATILRDEVTTIKAMAVAVRAVGNLTQKEVEAAERIISSLDNLIAQSEIEIAEVLKLRQSLADAGNVYSAPGAGENANTANCSDVYKNVKEFVEACKGAYTIRYQSLYASTHAEAFKRDYSETFKRQIAQVFESELSRLYPVYLKEATNVGKEVGVATGKKEIYQQSFARSENAAYGATLPVEVARVESEALALVEEHLKQNAALSLKGQAKLVSPSAYGIAPGATADLKMLMKNVGSVASLGNSLVKLTQLSPNLTADRTEAPITTVEARSQADQAVVKIKISDAAIPGSRVVVAGEIVHPGNHYRSSRVENFKIETVVGINPTFEQTLEMDQTPKVSNFLGIIKKQPIDITLKPKYAGVDQGYELTLEEVGTKFVEIVNRPAATEVLGRGVAKKVQFVYKLSKASRGQLVTLKLTVKNAGKVVSEQNLQIKPE
jgi:DNA repair exonuclease SbcCD ATPase subunit